MTWGAGIAVAAALAVAPAPVRAAGCGEPILGLEPLLRPGLTLLLGEIHGTAEIPRFVGDAACVAAKRALATIVLLEVGASNEPAFERFLSSRGTPDDTARLVASGHFQTPYPDGRSSVAMVELLEQLRRLRREGRAVRALGLIEAGTADGDRLMAARLLRARAEAPDALFLVLAGNNHTRVGPIDSPYAGFSMGQALREAGLLEAVSLDFAAGPGTFWTIRGATAGSERRRGPDRGRQRFVALHPRGDGPFDGTFYVPRTTASPPACPRCRDRAN